MDLLQPRVQPYAWGSRSAIAGLQRRAVPSDGPEAELWMGAHPSAPSGLTRAGMPTTLDALIEADPIGELGARCVQRFGGRLPFLLKVLAAEKALSIQVHPDRQQAEVGFRAENERGLAPDEAGRNYADDWPKPEVICALTSFEVLAGLRPPQEASALLAALAVERLRPVAGVLRADPSSATRALELILTWVTDDRAALVDDVLVACRRLAGSAGPFALPCAALVEIAADHPGDLGVVASLLMRHLVLQPGQALFVPAGGLHAYVRGTGVELLANSDNVLRAGLTTKHIDVAELLRLVDPKVEVPVLLPRPFADRITVYDTPVPEFRLYRLDPDESAVELPGEGPRIVLCVDGEAGLSADRGDDVELGRGESCFLPACDEAVTVRGPASLFVATTGY